MNKYYRAQEERNGIIKILENLSFDFTSSGSLKLMMM